MTPSEPVEDLRLLSTVVTTPMSKGDLMTSPPLSTSSVEGRIGVRVYEEI